MIIISTTINSHLAYFAAKLRTTIHAYPISLVNGRNSSLTELQNVEKPVAGGRKATITIVFTGKMKSSANMILNKVSGSTNLVLATVNSAIK